MNLEDLKKWFANLLNKVFGLFEGKENLTPKQENELLVSIVDDNEEEISDEMKNDMRDAISQICEEIDMTYTTYEEFQKSGKDPEDCLDEALRNDALEMNDPLSGKDIEELKEEAAVAASEEVSETMNK